MATTEHPDRADIIDTWNRRRLPTLVEGVNHVTFESIRQFDAAQRFVQPENSPALPERLRTYTYQFVLDEVTTDSGTRMPRLIHRRRRVVCEGVTVEEYIEPLDEALKRGQYLPLDVRQ